MMIFLILIISLLQAKIDMPIYMRLPTVRGVKGKIVLLNRSLYGLKQAGYLWNLKLHKSLVKMGFVRSLYDPTVYSKRVGGQVVHVGVYVDDIVIIGKEASVVAVVSDIEREYTCSGGKEIHHMLHIKIRRNRAARSVSLSQPNYITEVLEHTGMRNAVGMNSIVMTPEDSYNNQLLSAIDKQTYQSIIGKLVWISRATRPDISHAVCLLAKRVSSPKEVDMGNVKKLLRYLKATLDHGITLGCGAKLIGYSDANWITASDTMSRSMSGYVFLINGPISWSTKEQPIIALSSTESEFIALNHAGRESRWIEQLAKSLDIESEETIYCDNQSTIALISSTIFHKRTKHIAVRYNWIKDAVANNFFKVLYIPTAKQLADIFTKILSPSKHAEMMSMLHIEYQANN
jgi:hypothetical protein